MKNSSSARLCPRTQPGHRIWAICGVFFPQEERKGAKPRESSVSELCETQTLHKRGRGRHKMGFDAQEWRFPQHRTGTARPCLHRGVCREFWLGKGSTAEFLAKMLQFCIHSPFNLEINSISIILWKITPFPQPRAEVRAHPSFGNQLHFHFPFGNKLYFHAPFGNKLSFHWGPKQAQGSSPFWKSTPFPPSFWK